MEEKTLDDFFKSSEPTYKSKTKYKKENNKRKEKKSYDNSKIVDFFKNKFSFDHNVDLTNQTNVLYRRNYCIRNIINLLNLVFILFSFVGISKSNYIITIVFFLLVTGLSQTIKQMLKTKKNDHSHQTIIMYLQSLFLLVLSVSLYIKVFLGFTLSDGTNDITKSQFSVTQAAYFLIYISIFVMALYQDPKLLRTMFFWSLIIITAINLTALHPELYKHATSVSELFNYAFKENKTISTDILLRTIVFLVFYAALYSSTSVTHYIYEERKTEFKKRVGVETNFKDVVESVFEAVKVYNLNEDLFQQRIASRRVQAVSTEIAKSMNFSYEKVNNIKDQAVVHCDKLRELSVNEYTEITSENFEVVLEKTKLATTIIKRLQLHKKAEDMVQAVFQLEADSSFQLKMTTEKKEEISNIILLSEIYDILRVDRPYKKALNHKRAVELIMNDFSIYFDSSLILRFSKFNNEIKTAYERT